MRFLGLDLGQRRVGVALSDELGLIAQPWDTLPRLPEERLLAAIAGICKDKTVGAIVVGLPLNMDGTRGPMAVAAEGFARRLEEQLGVQVFMWDERLSTRSAEHALLDADVSRRKRRGVVDKVAAVIILQSFLDRRTAQAGKGQSQNGKVG